jgi:hypothetical protein
MKKAIFGHTTRPGVQASFVSKAYCPPGNIMGISKILNHIRDEVRRD